MNTRPDLFNFLVAGLATISLALTPMLAALSEDASMCHDLPEKEKVLKEGQKFLDENGNIRSSKQRGPGDFLRSTPNLFIPDEIMVELDEDTFDLTEPYREPITCPTLVMARDFESHGNLIEANKYYLKSLDNIELKAAPKQESFIAMEGAARTKILLSAKSSGAADSFKYSKSLSLNNQLAAIKNSTLDVSTLEEVRSLFWRALDGRVNYFGRHGKDDLLLAAECDKKLGHPEKAFELLLSALDDDRNATNCMADLILKFPATSSRYELRLLPLIATGRAGIILSALINVAISNGHKDHAIALFEQYAERAEREKTSIDFAHRFDTFRPGGKHSNRDGSLNGQALIALLDILPDKDKDLVVNYLDVFWLDFSIFDEQHQPVLDKIKKLGWNESLARLFKKLSAHQDKDCIAKIIALAEWAGKNGRNELFISQIKTALKVIPGRHDSFMQTLENTERVKMTIIAFQKDPNSLEIEKREIDAAIRECKNQERKRQCLEMASKLNSTAFDLERNRHYEMAAKLYRSAFEVKSSNLDPGDPELANQMIDMARVAGKENQHALAEEYFEQALAILKTSLRADKRDYLVALQSYGQMLNDSNQPLKAEKIYDEARKLSTE